MGFVLRQKTTPKVLIPERALKEAELKFYHQIANYVGKYYVELDDIEVDYRLSVLKPLHIKWLVELYNNMSTNEGKEVAANGQKQAGIFDAVKLGSSGLPSLDPFADIYPLIESLQFLENLSLLTLFPEELDCFGEKIEESEDDSDSEWEPDGDSDDFSELESDDDGNTSDAFDDGL